MSLMAGICNERGRLAARSGLGAVMGSKNVKAIVVNASKNIIGSSPEIMKQVRQSLDEFAKPITNFFRTYGTTGITNSSAMSGDAPVKNWGGAGMVDFPQGMGMSGDNFNRRMDKKYACWHCPVACGGESYAWDEQENQAKLRIAKREGEIAELRASLASAADDQKQGIEANIAKLENGNKADGTIKNDARYPYPHHTHRAEYETTTSGTMMRTATSTRCSTPTTCATSTASTSSPPGRRWRSRWSASRTALSRRKTRTASTCAGAARRR
jgi:hypothetical protein